MTSSSIPANMAFVYPAAVLNGCTPYPSTIVVGSPWRIAVNTALYKYKMTPELTRTKPASMVTLNASQGISVCMKFKI